MVFGKPKKSSVEDPVVEDQKEIAKLKEEIKKLEEETSDEEILVKEVVQKEPKVEETKTEEPKEYIQVVKEIPVQEIRRHLDKKTGVITNFITIEEALTKIMGEI